MSKIDDAIVKINEAMQKDAANKYLEIVGQYIIDRVTNEASAELVLAEDKTLSGACDAIKALAAKNSRGNVGVVSDIEGLAAVDRYFGFDEASGRVSVSAADLVAARRKQARRVTLGDIL